MTSARSGSGSRRSPLRSRGHPRRNGRCPRETCTRIVLQSQLPSPSIARGFKVSEPCGSISRAADAATAPKTTPPAARIETEPCRCRVDAIHRGGHLARPAEPNGIHRSTHCRVHIVGFRRWRTAPGHSPWRPSPPQAGDRPKSQPGGTDSTRTDQLYFAGPSAPGRAVRPQAKLSDRKVHVVTDDQQVHQRHLVKPDHLPDRVAAQVS